MDYFKAFQVEQVGPDVKYLQFSTFNMKGYFPAKLLNMMVASQSQKGVTHCYKQLREIEDRKK